MFDNIVNILTVVGITGSLYFLCDVSVEASLLVGFVALAAFSLTDINRHLSKK